jgi:hypothetical protein
MDMPTGRRIDGKCHGHDVAGAALTLNGGGFKKYSRQV